MAKMQKCAWCQMMFERGPETCPYCHKKIVVLPDGTISAEGMKPCPFCGKPNKPDGYRCVKCSKVMDGSDIMLSQTPYGEKIVKFLNKVWIGCAILLIPSLFVGDGWFLALFFVAVAAGVHIGTFKGTNNLKEASDSTFMLSLLFILVGGGLSVSMIMTDLQARGAKVDHSTPDQLLIMSLSMFLMGLAGVLWASRQGIPNIWKYIKGLYKD